MKFNVLILFITMAFVACDKDDPKEITSMDPECEDVFTDMLDAQKQFTFNLFGEVHASEEADKNIFLSPLSASLALGMTTNGALGNTLSEMQTCLSIDPMTLAESNQGYRCLIDYYDGLDPMVEMDIANSIWYRKGIPVKPNFINANQEYFDGEVKELEFNEAAKDEINQWVADNTQDKIQSIVQSIPSDAIMYLINAIYFKGTWKFQFDESATANQAFYKTDQSQVDVDFMKQKESFNYLKGDDFAAIDLPYGDEKYSMRIVLPDYGVDINEFTEQFSAEKWEELSVNMQAREVNVSIPKFTIEYQKTLNDALMNLGMEAAFRNGAELNNIADLSLMISKVLQKTFVEVNEEGTEAAAVTSVEVVVTSVDPNAPPYFTANRPFLFAIYETQNGNISFLGKMMNPAEDGE